MGSERKIFLYDGSMTGGGGVDEIGEKYDDVLHPQSITSIYNTPARSAEKFFKVIM